MTNRDYRDIIGGILLLVFGLFITAFCAITYDLGSLRRMGTGLFPTALGALLAVLGFIVVLPALFRSGQLPSLEIRSLLMVTGSLLAFVVVSPFGMMPAVFALTLVCTLVDRRLTGLTGVVLASSLSIVAALIFRLGLGLQFYLFDWPF